MSTFFKAVGVLILGALGALLFVVFLLPYILVNPAFANYQFVKDFKEGKIVVNQKESIYIQDDTALQNSIEKVKGSLVTIQAQTPMSGLIATSDGNIVTLAQGIPSSGNVNIFLQGQKETAKIVKVDTKNNLTLLKIEKNNLQTVPFANSNSIKLGQKVFLTVPTSIKQDNWLANTGIIKEIDTLPDARQLIKTTITETSITAGAPLFDLAGELVGISFVDSSGKILAIPIGNIQALLGF